MLTFSSHSETYEAKPLVLTLTDAGEVLINYDGKDLPKGTVSTSMRVHWAESKDVPTNLQIHIREIVKTKWVPQARALAREAGAAARRKAPKATWRELFWLKDVFDSTAPGWKLIEKLIGESAAREEFHAGAGAPLA